MSDIAGLKKNVGFLNWAVGVVFVSGLGAMIALYFILSGQIDTRFNKADDKIATLSSQVGDLRVTVAGVQADTKTILEKLDGGKSSEGARTEPHK